MKLGKIVEAFPALQKVGMQDLSMKTLYRVSNIMREVQPHLDFYNEQHRKIIEKYCTPHNNEYRLIPENRDEFEAAMSELLNLDVDMSVDAAIIPEDEGLKLSYSDMCALEGLIKIQFNEEGENK